LGLAVWESHWNCLSSIRSFPFFFDPPTQSTHLSPPTMIRQATTQKIGRWRTPLFRVAKCLCKEICWARRHSPAHWLTPHMGCGGPRWLAQCVPLVGHPCGHRMSDGMVAGMGLTSRHCNRFVQAKLDGETLAQGVRSCGLDDDKD